MFLTASLSYQCKKQTFYEIKVFLSVPSKKLLFHNKALRLTNTWADKVHL